MRRKETGTINRDIGFSDFVHRPDISYNNGKTIALVFSDIGCPVIEVSSF
jgi:hypothetical protein